LASPLAENHEARAYGTCWVQQGSRRKRAVSFRAALRCERPFRHFDALSFPRWILTRVLVEAVVLAVICVTAKQSVPVPDCDSRGMNPEHLGDFFHGQHDGLAQTIISRRELIVSAISCRRR
jgi:hypothetical protein